MARRPLNIGDMTEQEFKAAYRYLNRPPWARFVFGALIGAVTALAIALFVGHY